ncbi:hypothetical protein PPERSA_11718 [Pseudocohnilembus persalinus]|uniref:Uncharacterized protein n=1 Tax=Pseudocohnilembus persalinus TaxID=266149 RepID=A0A0V0QGH3_PSEPJ|nr:hypothetical protein PPERSA_11718 [Pseudocohnilembus persalinus]|eukprot:KRX01271.1 hypothetical protein PPERSA_11718 [Pseudocohnilembus persalinus]
MEINFLLFPRLKSSYSHENLQGNIIYIPKLQKKKKNKEEQYQALQVPTKPHGPQFFINKYNQSSQRNASKSKDFCLNQQQENNKNNPNYNNIDHNQKIKNYTEETQQQNNKDILQQNQKKQLDNIQQNLNQEIDRNISEQSQFKEKQSHLYENFSQQNKKYKVSNNSSFLQLNNKSQQDNQIQGQKDQFGEENFENIDMDEKEQLSQNKVYSVQDNNKKKYSDIESSLESVQNEINRVKNLEIQIQFTKDQKQQQVKQQYEQQKQENQNQIKENDEHNKRNNKRQKSLKIQQIEQNDENLSKLESFEEISSQMLEFEKPNFTIKYEEKMTDLQQI